MSTYFLASPRWSSTTSDVLPLVSLSDRDKIMAVLSDPSKHGPEVHRAIHVLKYAGRSTFDINWSQLSETADSGDQVQSLVDFFFDVPAETDEKLEGHCDAPDVPQYVPVGWAESLDVPVIENNEFRLPWLEDF